MKPHHFSGIFTLSVNWRLVPVPQFDYILVFTQEEEYTSSILSLLV